MGNYFSQDQTFYVYRRTLTTDVWVSTPLHTWATTLEDALSQFKHETFSFSLAKHKEYADTKAIYLYCGSERIAKTMVEQDTNQVTVWSTSIREWLTSNEKLTPDRYPLMNAVFFKRYSNKHAWINQQTIVYVQKV